MKALRGAQATIEKYKPIVIIEDNGLTDGEPTGASIEWLLTRGYRKVVKHRHDVLLAPTKEEINA